MSRAHAPHHPHARRGAHDPSHAWERHPRSPAKDAFDWSASGWAGLVGGGAFILIQTTFVSLLGQNPDADGIRSVAAMALGESVLPAPTPVTAVVFLAAAGVHLTLSLIYARILAVLVQGLPLGRAVTAGAAFGTVLYAVNYYAFSDLFPWFEAARGAPALLAHAAFGMIAAGTYARLTLARGPSAPSGPTLL